MDKPGNIIVDVEQGFNDTVFRSTKYNRTPKANSMLSMNNAAIDGTYYNEPDDATYVFKTTRSDIHTIIHGIVRPVRYNNIITNRLVNGLANKQKGIYIVKYFNFYKSMDIKSIMNFYATTAVDIDPDILDTLSMELSGFVLRVKQPVLKFRLIKFISEKDMLSEGRYHDDWLNGEIVIGDPTRLSYIDKVPVVTTLTIEITDNKQDIYHMAIGSEIHNIYTGNNANGATQGHIKLVNHGMVLIDAKLNTDNLKQYGLFASRKEALEFINIDKRLEMMKLSHERMKYESDVELTKLKRQMQIDTFAIDMYKRKTDIELSKMKYNHERIKLYSSLSTFYIKTGIAVGSKIISMFVPMFDKIKV